MSQDTTQFVNPFRIALIHRCPKCEKGKLYRSFTNLTDSCSHCGLSFATHDIGDGPAFFTICVLGFLITGMAVFAEITFKPPYWIHAVLWPVSMAILTPFFLRFFKSYLLAMQYKVHLLEQHPPQSR